ncbi:hypothetical protein FTV88_0664 [Heliorestis convoluta]|uniref:Uncharacterized protein n=1 Tax=Heliorestis convoluta TaxID=356322 RepID=A0A5Q2N0P3_9FIRM|nr:hypothetical protein FTV88_0664 [Heliorestis convoluta]
MNLREVQSIHICIDWLFLGKKINQILIKYNQALLDWNTYCLQ